MRHPLALALLLLAGCTKPSGLTGPGGAAGDLELYVIVPQGQFARLDETVGGVDSTYVLMDLGQCIDLDLSEAPRETQGAPGLADRFVGPRWSVDRPELARIDPVGPLTGRLCTLARGTVRIEVSVVFRDGSTVWGQLVEHIVTPHSWSYPRLDGFRIR